MSLRDRIMKESKEGGFTPHPTGDFAGKILEIKQRSHEGRNIYEIWVQTSAGRKTKQGFWETRVGDINGQLLQWSKDSSEAEEKYIKHMGRMIRLFTDLGLPEPQGQTEEDLENYVYNLDNLASLVGRDCKVVVKTNDNDSNNPFVFINAPDDASKRMMSNGASQQRSSGSNKQPASNQQQGGLGHVPF